MYMNGAPNWVLEDDIKRLQRDSQYQEKNTDNLRGRTEKLENLNWLQKLFVL